jgi:hypothetical protein
MILVAFKPALTAFVSWATVTHIGPAADTSTDILFKGKTKPCAVFFSAVLAEGLSTPVTTKPAKLTFKEVGAEVRAVKGSSPLKGAILLDLTRQ